MVFLPVEMVSMTKTTSICLIFVQFDSPRPLPRSTSYAHLKTLLLYPPAPLTQLLPIFPTQLYAASYSVQLKPQFRPSIQILLLLQLLVFSIHTHLSFPTVALSHPDKNNF
jgi:hypothetical protein